MTIDICNAHELIRFNEAKNDIDFQGKLKHAIESEIRLNPRGPWVILFYADIEPHQLKSFPTIMGCANVDNKLVDELIGEVVDILMEKDFNIEIEMGDKVKRIEWRLPS